MPTDSLDRVSYAATTIPPPGPVFPTAHSEVCEHTVADIATVVDGAMVVVVLVDVVVVVVLVVVLVVVDDVVVVGITVQAAEELGVRIIGRAWIVL